jgi:hypothetical protein
MADAPLRAGMAQVLGLIWASREADSFFAADWTGQITLKGLKNFLFWRKRPWPVGRVSEA